MTPEDNPQLRDVNVPIIVDSDIPRADLSEVHSKNSMMAVERNSSSNDVQAENSDVFINGNSELKDLVHKALSRLQFSSGQFQSDQVPEETFDSGQTGGPTQSSRREIQGLSLDTFP
ncbi:hypothetical protein H2248_003901 [Termitomyces sp. 'cryptogamus']|nr:hypothetical protein H2248_003901 [Termitomyces sp. 'cryptogamus']